MSDDDDNDNGGVQWDILDRPYSYVIFPLIVVFVVVFVGVILYNRRRRRRLVALHGHNWPGGRQNPLSHIPAGRRARMRGGRDNRWAPWGSTRSQEGLNELGEAPPPYDGKRDGEVRQEEMRDLERGEGPGAASGSADNTRPPEYISEPGPAIVRPDNRWG
jgi:hypothetical protein